MLSIKLKVSRLFNIERLHILQVNPLACKVPVFICALENKYKNPIAIVRNVFFIRLIFKNGK